jgi:hypothetical protein
MIGLRGALRTMLDRFSMVLSYMNGVGVPWGYAVSDGQIAGKVPLHVDAFDAGVDALTGTAVWPSSVAYTWQTADQTLTVSSSDADDTLAGNGARTIRIWWLNAAGAEFTTDVNMNGVGAVVTGAVTARRVNRIAVLTAGPTFLNEGLITVYATDGVTPMYAMSAYRGVSDSGIQTVPAGKRDYVERICYSDYTNPLRLFFVYRTSTASPWLFTVGRYVNLGGSDMVFDVPIRLEAGTDYYVWALAAGGATCHAELRGWREAV